MYAWPKNAIEIIWEISEAHGRNWDSSTVECLLCRFVEENCDPEVLKRFLTEVCKDQERADAGKELDAAFDT